MTPNFRSVVVALLGSVVLAGCQILPEKQAGTEPASNHENTAQSQDKTTPESGSDSQAKADQPQSDLHNPNSDLWDLTRAHYALNLDRNNSRINAQVKWFKKHPRYVDRVVKRASRYYHYILHETIKRGMPAELALLPIVESAYDPFAYSHGRAAGAWQFIPSTGKYFGLKKTWWYDGRRDIVASTDAALTYLQQLHKRFDDWELALAAYNAGGGTVSLAMKKNRRKGKPTDFWSLKLPAETTAYVPKLLAVAKVFRDPQQHGITLQPLKNEPYFKEIATGSQIDLAQAADLAGIDTQELYLLNPGFNRWATDPAGPHRLLIPVDKAAQFETKLAALPAEQRVKWTRHKIKSGESLIGIAKKYRTTVEVVRTANNITGNNIRAGKTLVVPTASQHASAYVMSQAERLNRKQEQIARRTNRQKVKHTVKNGESFWTISRKHKVGVRQLASWNNMAPGDPLMVGKTLVIWKTPKTTGRIASQGVIRKVGYTVRSGDSLSRIANRFNVSVNNIVAWNGLERNNILKPGQRLTLHVDVTQAN